MLNLFPSMLRDCEGVRRREFLKIGALSGLGISLPSFLAQRAAMAKQGVAAKDINCIAIWTQGGTSHHDTFDPKPGAAASVRGEFKCIDTAIPGVQFTEVCSNFAKEAKRFSVLRSLNPRNGSHGTADAYMMSGRKFNPAQIYPTYGSVVSHQKGFKTAMPAYVQLGDNIDYRFGGGVAGHLGAQHNPFKIVSDANSPEFSVRDITLPKGIDMGRVQRRQTMLGAIDDLQREAEVQPAAFDALDEHFKAAFKMITAPETKKAFDLASETDKTRDAYGRTKFGQSALLARRLIESGVRFVTLTDGGWDTHQNNFTSLKTRLMPPVDQALPTLFADLEARGMLESTMVIWLTDFGRTPKINSASGRDHWASAAFAVAAGAGIPGGLVLGKTDDEGGAPVSNEYFAEDIGATIYTKLGIPLDLVTYTPENRPIELNNGKVIREWM